VLQAWNDRDADAYASLFAEDGNVVGFDGSIVDGRDAIREHLSAIFADHEVARYVRIVREVRELGDGVVLLRAVVGMIPPGQSELRAETNAVQSMVVADGEIALFQNTPAAFHGRPDEAERLTQELRKEGSL
jgi:uncharacterized protein (TIGR02246 family)